MVTLREAAQQALEELEALDWECGQKKRTHDIITALRAALAEPDTLDFETLRRYALEAGIVVTTDTPAQEENARKCFGKFAALVAAHERNRCAKVFQRRMERVLFNFKEELDDCVSLVRGEE